MPDNDDPGVLFSTRLRLSLDQITADDGAHSHPPNSFGGPFRDAPPIWLVKDLTMTMTYLCSPDIRVTELDGEEFPIRGFRQTAQLLPGSHSLAVGYSNAGILANPVRIQYEFQAGGTYEMQEFGVRTGEEFTPEIIDCATGGCLNV